MSTMNRLLVIGAGVAGCSFAIRLLEHGFHVDIAEKAVFPRNKVCGCCIGGTGISLLNLLGLGDWLKDHAVSLVKWQGAFDQHTTCVKLQSGAAISRQSLDTKLLARAVELGAAVYQPCAARIESQSAEEVSVTLGSESGVRSLNYSLVVVAAGLNANCFKPDDRSIELDWIDPPHGPFGVAVHVDGLTEVEPGVIYMVCNDDGYVGLVRLEDGYVDVAAALQRRLLNEKATPQERLQRMLGRCPLSLGEFDVNAKLMTTPPLRRRRLAGRGRILAIGDAAGYIEPFTGEGMTWGMHAAIVAADSVAGYRAIDSSIGQSWHEAYAAIQRWHRLQCRVMTSALTSRWLRQGMGLAMRTAPWLASPITRSLGKPTRLKPIQPSSDAVR